jgi:5'-3' exonuclease
MPAKRPLIDFAIVKAVERHAEMLKLDDYFIGLAAHEFNRILVTEIIRTLHGVIHMPVPVIFFFIAELVERTTRALGVVCWPMVEFEADDALATAAFRFADHDDVERVVIASPDKDLTQCTVHPRVVTWDRIRDTTYDARAVEAKFGVRPQSIPDYLALVGDPQDGIPGVARWGKKAAASVLARYLHLERIPRDPSQWNVDVRGKPALAENLFADLEAVLLYRTLATLRRDVPLAEALDDLRHQGASRAALSELVEELEEPELEQRVVYAD